MRCKRCGSADIVLFKDTNRCSVCDSTNIIGIDLSRNEQKEKSVMKEFLRVALPIASCGAGFVVGAVLWVNEQRWFVEEQNFGELFLWSGTSAVIGGFIGYGISRLIK
jgi:hypothetical protein